MVRTSSSLLRAPLAAFRSPQAGRLTFSTTARSYSQRQRPPTPPPAPAPAPAPPPSSSRPPRPDKPPSFQVRDQQYRSYPTSPRALTIVVAFAVLGALYWGRNAWVYLVKDVSSRTGISTLLGSTSGLTRSASPFAKHCCIEIKASLIALKPAFASEYMTSSAFGMGRDADLRAIQAALSLPSSRFEPDPLLKVSGLYEALAGQLEQLGDRAQAYTVLRTALTLFGPDPLSTKRRPRERISGEWAGKRPLTDSEVRRAIAIALKMGHLAIEVDEGFKASVYPRVANQGPRSWFEAAKTHLEQAMAAILANYTAPDLQGRINFGRHVDLPSGPGLVADDEDMFSAISPELNLHGIGTALAQLAHIYQRSKQYPMADVTYAQAVNTLLPYGALTPTSDISVADRCQAAYILNQRLANWVNHPANSLDYAEFLAHECQKILEGAMADKNADDFNCALCKQVLAHSYFNRAMIAERRNSIPVAMALMHDSVEAYKAIGDKVRCQRAEKAFHRLGSKVLEMTKSKQAKATTTSQGGKATTNPPAKPAEATAST